MDINISLIILAVIVGFIVGYFYGTGKEKAEGKIEFFLSPLDDENEVVQCSVLPDKDWEELMNQETILFRIVKDPKIQIK